MNTTKRLWLAIGLASITLVSAQAVARAEEYAVPGHGTLVLATPAGWRAQSRSIEEPSAVGLRFRPESGDAFDVQVTSLWVDPVKLAGMTPESLKAQVQSSAAKVLPSSREKEAKIVELGGRSRGYYYSLTDRGEPTGPGDYKYLTQGTVVVGELLILFTILHREGGVAAKDQALRMLADATYSEIKKKK